MSLEHFLTNCLTTMILAMTNQQAREFVENGGRLSSPEGTPPSVYKMISECWAADPQVRPSFKDIVLKVDPSAMLHFSRCIYFHIFKYLFSFSYVQIFIFIFIFLVSFSYFQILVSFSHFQIFIFILIFSNI